MTSDQTTQIYAIFHLNLAFSSVEESAHEQVVQNCYWPILELIENDKIPLGIELTAHTLEMIEAVNPNWVTKFRELLQADKCELLASGDSQIIGPLVPAELNEHNLRLGLDTYKAKLGVRPKLAYVNEQAVSRGLLDIYLETGFDAVVVEWDNPYSHNPDWSEDLLHQPQNLLTAKNKQIPVIWNNAVAFQKLQRYVHDEIILDDYLDYLKTNISHKHKAFSLYGNDAEIFDFRPGRYVHEAASQKSEWSKVKHLFQQLQNNSSYEWKLPHETLTVKSTGAAIDLSNAAHPVSVKKQAKYNITRWALSGRNDLFLNSLCFAQYNAIKTDKRAKDSDWRKLCRLWASDLRTHLTPTRYTASQNSLPHFHQSSDSLSNISAQNSKRNQSFHIEKDKARNKLHIKSDSLHLTLNANRGLTIENLAFSSQNYTPIIGTLPHGHFNHIRYAADFYSNHLVMERFRERDRVTDLSRIAYNIYENGDNLKITGTVTTPFGEIFKAYLIEGERIFCTFKFSHNIRPEASLRLGFLTLCNCDQRLWFTSHNGGHSIEYFQATEDFDHGAPVSSIVSASSAVGATEGKIWLGNNSNGLEIAWDPASCAALPMLSSKKVNDHYLNRFWFSLIEADETLKADGHLLPFTFSLSPSKQP